MSGTPPIATLVPHTGRMCLLERIVAWDVIHVLAATNTHRDPCNPLVRSGRLRAIHLCEYGAQAMAVHGGLLAPPGTRVARRGLLASIRDVSLDCDFIHALPGELAIEAWRLGASADVLQYEFSAHHEGRLLARGQAMIALVQEG